MDAGYKFLRQHLDEIGVKAECVCHRCIERNNIRDPAMPVFSLAATVMILCPKCGNKRCPHASDHNLECTNSNALGQPGSVY